MFRLRECMFKLLRWRREAIGREDEDANSIVRKSNDLGEQSFEPDPIAELVRIVGESPPDHSRPRPSARRPPHALADKSVLQAH